MTYFQLTHPTTLSLDSTFVAGQSAQLQNIKDIQDVAIALFELFIFMIVLFFLINISDILKRDKI